MGLQAPDMSENSIVRIMPSQFKPYDVDFFEIRSFSIEELKYLNTENLSEEKLVEIYRNNVENFDVMKMSWTDFLFLCAHITLFTDPSTEWDWPVICHFCGKISENKLNSKRFFEFHDMEAPDYPITYTIDGKEFVFGITTVQDHLKWMEGRGDIDPVLIGVYSISYMVKNMPQEEAYKLLLQVRNKEHQEALKIIDEQLQHDTEPLKLTCKHCKKEGSYSVVLEVTSLRPFRVPKGFAQLGILFGKNGNGDKS